MTAADDDAPRPLPALRFAGKLERLSPGEHVVVSTKGGVLGPGAIRGRMALYFGTLALFCGATIWATPVFGGLYTAGLGALVATRLVRQRRYNRIPRLIVQDRLDEAARELEALERSNRLPAWRAPLANWRTALCWRRGELEAALVSARRCQELLPGPSRGRRVVYWQNQFALANLLLALDRADEAAPAIAQAMRAPAGEWYRLQQRGLEAHRAFVTGRHDELGSDDDLHDRAREALRYNHTGILLATLAWAYEQRGDHDMATHLIAEAPSRFLTSIETQARTYPRVWAWLGPRLPAPDADPEALEAG